MKKIPHVLFICTLIFAPLAFGTVEQWSILTVEILIALAVIVYCIQLITTSGSFLHVPGFIPLLLLMGWMIFQLVPLPVILVKVLSPATYQVYKPIYDMLEGNRWMPLTVYQKGTIQESLRIVSYILFYILTIQLLSGGERLKQTVKICSWLAIGVAVLAILQKFSSPPHTIYWFRVAPLDSTPIGPWINHSQYCGYIEAVGPVVLALLLYYWPVFSTHESLRKRIIAFFTVIGGNLHIILGIGMLVMTSSVFISMSRGGIISFTFSLLFFFIILRKRQPKYSNLFFAGVAACLLTSITFLVGWETIFERFGHTFTDGGIKFDRIPIWQNSLEIFRDYWFAGSGFGTFVNIFPDYKTIPDDYIYDHAHNDYIELLTDGGIVGFILVAWFVIAVVREGWKMIGRRRDRYSILMSIGALSGIVAMLIHGVSDFNMHNGADGLYFFFLCGLLVSAGNTRLQYHSQSTLLPRMSWPSKNLLLGAALLFLGAVIVGQGGAMVARWKYESVKDIYLSRQLAGTYLQQISTTVKQAARLDPFEGMHPFLLGDVARFQGHLDKALEYYVQAGKKEPLEGAFLQRIGLMLPKEHQQFAEVLMEKGAKSTFKKDDMMLSRAEWLLETGQREKAIEILRDGLLNKPRLVSIVAPFLQGASFTREEITAVLPLSVEAWIQYGSFLEKTGNPEDAEHFYSHALVFLEGEKNIQTKWFMHLYAFYTKQKEEEKALEVLRLGITKIPDYAPLHIRLGDYYAKEGILYRAKEEYQQALLLEPNNESVRKAIERMNRSAK